jgi:HEAT repeat protein
MSVEKIAKLGEAKKVSKILHYAKSQKAEERAAAADALGCCAKDEAACNALVPMLRDSDRAVCIRAANALHKLNNKKAIEHLRNVAVNTTDADLAEACTKAAASLVDKDRR